MQKTLARAFECSGRGLFSGKHVFVRVSPASSNYGIQFERVDLPGASLIPAKLSSVSEALRTTKLAVGQASVSLVEHLLSALHVYGIDHAHIAVDGPEIPILDGSAKGFVEAIEEAGSIELEEPSKAIVVEEPLFWSREQTHLVALPSEEFRISYTLHYPESPLIFSQYYTTSIEQNNYRLQLAPCRTFALFEEVVPLVEKGLLKGDSLEYGLVLHGDKVLTPGGLRFRDEMVRHKILDLIGDLSLIGKPLRAHIIAIRSGHASNIAFARVLEERCARYSHEGTL